MSEEIQESPNDNFVNWVKKIPGGWKTGIVLLFVLAGAYIYYIHYFPWKTEGEIIVDEPKVYTRERLVNDRFREEAWLNEQLTRPKLEEFLLPEAKINSTQTQQRALAANATKSDGGETEQGQATTAPIQAYAPSLERAAQDIAASPVDTFSDMLDYRDKVRNELMRIQLDDRHDIEGNTLYRLNFDTAIIPGNNTHASAAVLVTISPDENTDKIQANSALLFDEWKGEMQTLVDSLIEDRFRVFKNIADNPDINKSDPDPDPDPFPSDEEAVFEDFLRQRIYEKVKNLSEILCEYPSKQVNSCKISDKKTQEPATDKSNTLASKVFYDCDTHQQPFFCEVEKLIGSYLLNFDLEKNNEEAVIFFDELKKRTRLTDVRATEELSNKIVQVCSTTSNKFFRPPNEVLYNAKGEVIPVDPDKKMPRHADDSKIIPCLQQIQQTNRLFKVMGLLERLSAVSAIPPEKIIKLVKTPSKFELYPRVIEELVRPYVYGKPDETNPYFHKNKEYEYITPYYKKVMEGCEKCKPSPDYPDGGLHQPQKNIKELMVTYEATKLKSLNKYFIDEVQGCDMQNCRLVLIPKQGANINLLKDLEHVTQTFSYAVTPQLQAQHIALLDSGESLFLR